MIDLQHGDCLSLMPNIASESIDLILCDLPYGTTTCSWDTILPFDQMWKEYERISKPLGAIVLFSTQPFTSALIMSNLKLYKYSWIWEKPRPGGFVNARLKPLKNLEDICVFSKGNTANGSKSNMRYFPQDLIKVDKKWKRPTHYSGSEGVSPHRETHALERTIEFTNYPRQILRYDNPNKNVLHPTQKPVDLLEYLIKTYTENGDTVLDNCMGSGSTGVAAINLNRNFIGYEKEQKYFDIAQERIMSADKTPQVTIQTSNTDDDLFEFPK